MVGPATPQPASPYGDTGAMVQPAVQQPASPYGETGAMVQPATAQPASPYGETGAMVQPTAPAPVSPYGDTGAMVQPTAPQPASPYGATGAMVQPATAQPASPYLPSGRMYKESPLRTASQQSPYDPLTGALVADQALPANYEQKVAAKDAARIQPEAVALPDITSLSDYQAMTAGGADPTMTGQSYADLTSGRTTPASMTGTDYAAMTAGGADPTMTGQSYADLTAGLRPDPQMQETLPWQDATMSGQSYADLTAGRQLQTQMQETLPWQDASMSAQSYADLTAGSQPQTQMPETLPWQDASMSAQSYADLTAGRGPAATMTPDDYTALTAGAAGTAGATTPAMAAEDYAALTAGPGAVETPAGADSLQAALQQAYMSRIGADDPILASQLADQQERQRQEEQATIEQLSRYGVLRGGGDTANVLTQMREGQERNRLALEASAAQRQQQDLRDALGFTQAQSQMGLAGRGMGLQERLGAQDIEGSRLQRELQRAGVTGQFRGGDTMAERELTDRLATAQTQRGAIGGAERRADIAQEAGMFGEIAGQGLGHPRQTLAGRAAREERLTSQAQRELAREAGQRAALAQEADLFGEVAGQGLGHPRQTVAGQAAREARLASQTQRELARAGDLRSAMAQEAGLFGEIAGQGSAPARETLGGMAAREARLASEAQRTALGGAERRADIAQEAGLFGEVAGQGLGHPRQTMAGRQSAEALLASEAQRTAMGGAERRADIAQEAGLFGEVAGQGLGHPRQTMAGEEADLRRELARSADIRQQQQLESGLFGQVATGVSPLEGPIQTLGGQQATEALKGQRLAREATEAGLTGQFRGDLTATERAQQSALESQDLQRRLAESGVTGEYDFGTQRGRIDTLQAQALESEMQGQQLQRALPRAGATGQFIEEGAPEGALPTETLESRLRTAGLTGVLPDQQGVNRATLAGRQADMDMIGAILAAQDPSLAAGQQERMRDLGGALAGALQGFDPRQVAAIQEALGYTVNPNGAGGTAIAAGGGGGGGNNVVLSGELTDAEKAQIQGDPLGTLDAAVQAGQLTPDVFKENFGAGDLTTMLQNAEADLATARNRTGITPEEIQRLEFIVESLRTARLMQE